MPIISNIIATFVNRFRGGLPSCVKDIAVAWYKNLLARNKVCEGNSDIIGVIDWDGVDDTVSFASVPDVTGDKIVTFNIYIESAHTFPIAAPGETLFAFRDSNDYLVVQIIGNTLRCFFEQSTDSKYIDISSYKDQGLEVVITKTTQDIVSISINGVNQSISQGGFFDGLSYTASYIGYTRSGISDDQYLEGAYIWGININDTNTWLGEPDGNQDSAWIDTTGSIDGTVNGTPNATSIPAGDISTFYCINDAIGTRNDTVFFGQYLSSGTIDFKRTTGTFDYTDPSDGSLVEGVSIPVDGLYTIPANGICDVVTSDGSEYPFCERAGTVLHDVKENSAHISVTTPVWAEALHGSDYLNQQGYVDKADFTAEGYDFETEVDGTTITLNDDCLVPLAQWTYVDLQDVNGENLLDENDEQLQVKQNI